MRNEICFDFYLKFVLPKYIEKCRSNWECMKLIYFTERSSNTIEIETEREREAQTEAEFQLM